MKMLPVRLVIISFLLFVLCAATTWGQNKVVDKQALYWFRYVNKIQLSSKFAASFDLNERVFTHQLVQHHFLVRSSIHYLLNENITAGGGLAYSLQSPHLPEGEQKLVVPEIRPHQELNMKQSWNKFRINHRFRLEERFFRKSTKDSLVSGYNFNFRQRYQLMIEVPLVIRKEKMQSLSLVVSDEIMINLGTSIVYNVFDQNRVYAGLRFDCNKHWGIEAGYLNWYQQRQNGNTFWSRNIISGGLLHKLNLTKNLNQ